MGFTKREIQILEVIVEGVTVSRGDFFSSGEVEGILKKLREGDY